MPHYQKPEPQMEYEPIGIDEVVKLHRLIARYSLLSPEHPVTKLLMAAGMGGSMSLKVHLIGKASRAILSCETPEQLRVATRYAELAVMKYRSQFKTNSIIDDIYADARAYNLSIELKNLRQSVEAGMGQEG